MGDVTQILEAIGKGQAESTNQLIGLLYDELRQMAARQLLGERAGLTLDATALVHEAYFRLIGSDGEQVWINRRHFFAAAAEAMRRILIDNARKKRREKHGGDRQRVELSKTELAEADSPGWLLAIDEGLDRLEQVDPSAAQVVNLRYFSGHSIEEAAELLGISLATAYRHWTYAKAWLHAEISDSLP